MKPAKQTIWLVCSAALALISFFAGFYIGRPSLNDLAGLSPNEKAPPERLLGVWDQVGEAPSTITFFRDWSYWYHAVPVIGRRIMGSYTFDGNTITLRPRFFTRASIDDASPDSMELSSPGPAQILKSEGGATFVKLSE